MEPKGQIRDILVFLASSRICRCISRSWACRIPPSTSLPFNLWCQRNTSTDINPAMIKSGCQAVTDRSAPPFMLLPFVLWPTYRHQYHTHTLSHTLTHSFLGLSHLIVIYLSSSSSSSVLVVPLPFLNCTFFPVLLFFLSSSSSSSSFRLYPPWQWCCFPHQCICFCSSSAILRINLRVCNWTKKQCRQFDLSSFTVDRPFWQKQTRKLYFSQIYSQRWFTGGFSPSAPGEAVVLCQIRLQFPALCNVWSYKLETWTFSFPVFVLDLTCAVPRNNLQGKMVVKFILQLAFLLF